MDGNELGRLLAQRHFGPIHAVNGRIAGRRTAQRQHPALRDEAEMHKLTLDFLGSAIRARRDAESTPSMLKMLEALALDEFRQGHLGRVELRRLLGFATRAKLDEFLTGHGVFGTYAADDLERDRRDLQRLGF